jgi:hypothetical protein
VSDTFFDAVSVVYGLAGVATLVQLVRGWRSFWGDGLTRADELLAWRIAFFVAHPFFVLLHELGHVAAVLQSGGHVATLSWRVYWGFVEPVGEFSPLQDWWIALAGNLASLLAGAIFFAAGMVATRLRQPLRALLVVVGFAELLFTLIGYPLISLGLFGDWDVIYDFSQTPAASAATAAVHGGLLVALLASGRNPSVGRLLATVERGGTADLAGGEASGTTGGASP